MIFCVSYNYIIEKAEILTLNENPTYVSDKRVCVLREVERYNCENEFKKNEYGTIL